MRKTHIITILFAALLGLTPAFALAQTRHAHFHYRHALPFVQMPAMPDLSALLNTSSAPAQVSAESTSPALTSTPNTPAPTVQAPVVAAAPETVLSDSFASQVEAEVLRLTNAQRAQYGLSPLSNDASLANIARAHSADMLVNNYFSHTNQSGCDGACRMTNAGYSWQAMGENIHAMWGYQMNAADTANKIVTDWMNSPGHRANILNSTFTNAGIGIAVQGTTIYSTADYALPR